MTFKICLDLPCSIVFTFADKEIDMDELECMRAMEESLLLLGDEGARSRVAGWIGAKYGPPGLPGGSIVPTAGVPTPAAISSTPGQIAGIAKLSQAGELQLTVRDLKARSTPDAAIRLVHVAIWASGKLLREPSVSSKKVLVPLMRRYRCYDGNVRGALAKDKGLVRDGDLLSLDFHAEQFAEKVVGEILDSAIEGKWKPGTMKRRASKSSRDSSLETL